MLGAASASVTWMSGSVLGFSTDLRVDRGGGGCPARAWPQREWSSRESLPLQPLPLLLVPAGTKKTQRKQLGVQPANPDRLGGVCVVLGVSEWFWGCLSGFGGVSVFCGFL